MNLSIGSRIDLTEMRNGGIVPSGPYVVYSGRLASCPCLGCHPCDTPLKGAGDGIS